MLAVIAVLLGCFSPAGAARDAPLERGAAVTDPYALRELDSGRFALARILGRVLARERQADTPLSNGELFALPSMAPVRQTLDDEFDQYVARHKAELPNESIGVGNSFAFQLFDRAMLYSDHTRFVLSGIVNRMDRAYVAPETCGEIRLIYRLMRTNLPEQTGDDAVSPRLPMTLMVVLKAKGDRVADRRGIAITCAEIARRWLATADWTFTGNELADKLTAPGGPLDLVSPDNLERIETNLQIAHAPKSAVRDFRTDYLMNVFDYDARSKVFVQAPMEDQIDRDRLLADASLRQAFKSWLLDPRHFSDLDRGTLVIPPEFLAKSAIAPTPVGFAVSNLQPEFGLVQGDAGTADPLFSEDDVVTALKKAAERGVPTQNIRSVAGFERRLNDITCAGCHQTRGIGGFHFPGVDWMQKNPSNSTFVPASPHFFGDQIRRRDILAALRDGRTPDYSRGFSNRPQLRGSTELAGTEYEDGWGSHCYQPQPGVKNNDMSFHSWTCAAGLACQVVDKASRMGMCFIKTR
ncbi:MAG TPA: hypothetical protein VHB49_17070 [Bradyrhizobium sp.]|nr:hypothetical protein [Bradyrhizobium sp.]